MHVAMHRDTKVTQGRKQTHTSCVLTLGTKPLKKKKNKTPKPMSNQREYNAGGMFLHALVAKAAQLQMNNSNQLGN